ncbi:hypothetical protein D3C84_890300 [compost metagenome]
MVGGDYTGRRDDAFSRLRFNCCVILLSSDHEIGPKLREVVSDISAHCPVIQAIISGGPAEKTSLEMPAVQIELATGESWQAQTVNLLIHEINRSAKLRNIPGIHA